MIRQMCLVKLLGDPFFSALGSAVVHRNERVRGSGAVSAELADVEAFPRRRLCAESSATGRAVASG